MISIEPIIGLALAIPFCAAFFILISIGSASLTFSFIILTLFSLAAFLVTLKLIPIFKEFNLRADLYGLDINKKGTSAGEKKM